MSLRQRRADALHLRVAAGAPRRSRSCRSAARCRDRPRPRSLNLPTSSASSAPSSTRATSDRRTIGAVALGDDQVLELLGRAQVGVREQIDLHRDCPWSGRPRRGSCCAAAPRATSPGARLRAARRSGSIQTRIASWRPPSMLTRCTPAIVENCGCSVRDQPVGDRRHARARSTRSSYRTSRTADRRAGLRRPAVRLPPAARSAPAAAAR